MTKDRENKAEHYQDRDCFRRIIQIIEIATKVISFHHSAEIMEEAATAELMLDCQHIMTEENGNVGLQLRFLFLKTKATGQELGKQNRDRTCKQVKV